MSAILFCGGLLNQPSKEPVAYAASDLPNANGADGSQAKPYIINEASDFTWVLANSSARSGYLLQTADIDLTGFSWSPIGPSNAEPFLGTYNGNGYTISNMTMNNGNLAYMGMFGYAMGATIKNITLSNVSMTGGQVQNQAAIGAIVGMASLTSEKTTVVERCHVIGTSSITGATNDTIGGIGGSNGGNIKYCSSAATVTSSNYDSGSLPYAAGIAGSNWGTIENCFNRGAISGGTSNGVGGITGFGYANAVTNCYSTGTITVGTGSARGAIIGIMTDASKVSGNYYLSGSATNGIGDLDSSNSIGYSTPSETGTTALTDANMKLQSNYSGWDFLSNLWLVQAGVNNSYPFLKGVAMVASTNTPSALTITTATIGGNVTAACYGTVTEKGIEYTESTLNTFNKVAASSAGTGAFSVNLTGLTPGTAYYARAYAVNEVGTSYGEPVLFTTNPLAPQLTMNLLQGSAIGTTKAVISDTATDHFVVILQTLRLAMWRPEILLLSQAHIISARIYQAAIF